MFKLVIQDDEGKTTVVPLIRDEITIGRKEGNTIRLTERNVSRRHARIVRNNGAVAIEDLGSYNGVRVNGTRIAQRTSLSVSDRVQIGDYLIELKAEGVEHVTDDGKTQPIERMEGGAYLEGMATAPTIPPIAPQAVTAAPTQPMAAPVVALADTDPAARAIAPAIAVAPMGQATGHARLVVLSSNFAGQEWELARSQMIVGRTEDNDVVINHRSISRNHAKISREPDTLRYTISDLQSSNGVRVNGEEYGKVELRRGDIIDLGHVRLRFVEPGEDFLFGRDAQIADVPTGTRGKGLMIFAAIALLAVGATAVFLLTRGKDTPKKPDDVITGSGDGTGTGSAPVVVTTTPDAGGLTGPTPGSADIAKLLEECEGYRDKADWLHTTECANQVIAKDPQNLKAKGLLEQAQREAKSELAAKDLELAWKAKNHQEVVRLYKDISPDSVYYAKAKKLHDDLRKQYIDDQLAWGKARARAHECKDIEVRAGQVAKIWPEAGDALQKLECRESGGGGGGGGGGSKPQCRVDTECNGADVCKGGKCVAPANTGTCDATTLLEEAKTAYGSNQWSKVLSKAEEANRCSASRFARNLALRAACRLQNKGKAQKYWKEFENDQGAKQACVGVVP